MDCAHYDAGGCRSCTLARAAVRRPGRRQAARGVATCSPAHAGPGVAAAGRAAASRASATRPRWSSPAPSRPRRSASSTPSGRGIDLRDCGLHDAGAARPRCRCWPAFVTPRPAPAVRRAEPPRRAQAPARHGLARRRADGALRAALDRAAWPGSASTCPGCSSSCPTLAVVSVNLQPEHKAVLEGEREIVLTERARPADAAVDGVDLQLRPQTFFQTNTDGRRRALPRGRRPGSTRSRRRTLWDLTAASAGSPCACARPGPDGARRRDQRRGGGRAPAAAPRRGRAAEAPFEAGDATAYAARARRRARPGGGQPAAARDRPRAGRLAGVLRRRRTSSTPAATPSTLARDLAAMPSLRPRRARLLDMFPQTGHDEVVVLLTREA